MELRQLDQAAKAADHGFLIIRNDRREGNPTLCDLKLGVRINHQGFRRFKTVEVLVVDEYRDGF